MGLVLRGVTATDSATFPNVDTAAEGEEGDLYLSKSRYKCTVADFGKETVSQDMA